MSGHPGSTRAATARLLAMAARLPAMTLRRRLVVAFAGLVTIAVALVGGISYSATVSTIHTAADRTLLEAAASVTGAGVPVTGLPPTPGGDADQRGRNYPGISLVQRIAPDGTVTVLRGTVGPLAVDAAQRRLAAAGAGPGRFDERSAGGQDYRIYTRAAPDGHGAVVVGLNLQDASRVQTRIAVDTALIGLAVILLAALAGWWIARQITRRLAALSDAAASVARTGDLTVPVTATGRDEVGRLAASLSGMLAQLAQSRDAQRRLVEDAGHELRTPITSLRTNASVLRRFQELPPDDRARLLDDVDGELRELTSLVDELVELATDTHPVEPAEDVPLRPLLERTAGRVRRRTGRAVTVDSDGSELTVQPHALERAVGNLLDNAAKFDPGGSAPIEIWCRGGRIRVSDRGPGVPQQELDRIFDRFHRSERSRGLPGSGLGLAIVRDVVAHHGGTVVAEERAGGGLTVTMDLSACLRR